MVLDSGFATAMTWRFEARNEGKKLGERWGFVGEDTGYSWLCSGINDLSHDSVRAYKFESMEDMASMLFGKVSGRSDQS